MWEYEDSPFIEKSKSLEMKFNLLGKNILTKNPNVRAKEFSVTLPKNEIDYPVFFEVTGELISVRAMIIDTKSSLGYYKEDKNDNFYKHADASDTRSLTAINLLDHEDSIVTISKNIFSVNLYSLEERPITILGSFCEIMITTRLSNLPEIFLCFGQGRLFLQAHYLEERYKAK